MKKGVQTSEFWLAVINAVVSVLVVSDVLSADEAGELVEVAVVLSGAIVTVIYTINRHLLKRDMV